MISKRGKKNMKFMTVCVVVVIIIGALVGLAMTPIFNIRKIKVSGNTHYSDDEIKNIIAIGVGDNWFSKLARDSKLTPKSLGVHRYIEGEKRVKKTCPYIKDVRIGLSGFGQYSVDVVEREPVALVSYLTTYVVVDKDGVALEVTDDLGNENIPKISGISLALVKLGDKIDMSEEKVKAFYKIYETIKKSDSNSNNLYSVIDYIDLNDLSDVKFFLDNRVLVYIGSQSNVNLYKINYLKEIFFNSIGDRDEGVLKFREKGYPTFTRKTYAINKR